jgi:hypothetical protein
MTTLLSMTCNIPAGACPGQPAVPAADVAAQSDAIARHRERIRRTALAPLFRAPAR